MPMKKKELRRFEVFFRCHSRGNNLENGDIKFIFNYISSIKNIQKEKSIELNYKTLLLSKVAHEFKNPLVCISELVNCIQDNFKLNENDSENMQFNLFDNDNIKNSFKQIKSMLEYLLLLIKDLDYFSHLQIKKNAPGVEISLVDVNEVSD